MDDHCREHYRALLMRYRAQGDEASLAAIAELGRTLVEAGVPPEDVVDMHHQVLAQLSAQDPSFTLEEALHLAAAPLLELAMAYGLAFREQLARRERWGHANLEAVVEETHDLILITDGQGRIEYVNPAFLDRTGYTRAECRGMTVQQLLNGGHQPQAIYRALQRASADGTSWRGRLLDRDRSGHRFVVDTSIFPLRGPNGDIVQYVVMARDLTYSIEQERAAQEKTQRLEAVATLAAGIAHDANNLLGTILGYTDLVAADTTDPLTRDNLEQIKLAALHTRDLIGQILAFARSDQSGTELELVRVVDLVHEVLQLLHPVAGPRLHCCVHERFPAATVAVRRGQLLQVLINLVLNAQQALGFEEGQIDIEIDRTDTPPPGFGLPVRDAGYVTIDVVDNGPGIPWELQSRVFDPFFTTKGNQGSGLGLSVAKTIIERHQGAIDLWSEPGHGTRFSIVLPFVQRVADIRLYPTFTPAEERVALIIDDDRTHLHLIRKITAHAGIPSLVLDNPWAALKAFHNAPERFFAVVTDQFMPELDGMRLIQHLRSLNPTLLIILFTAAPEQLDQAALVKLGVAACLPKPLDYNRLIKLLQAGRAREVSAEHSV